MQDTSGFDDRGAALVEFAFLAIPLFVVLFGIIEFGWAFYQQLDVSHGSREGARVAVVNYKTTAAPGPAAQTSELLSETCQRMDSGANVSVQFTQTGGTQVGDSIRVTASKPLDQLTGFLGFILDDITLSSTVESRLEQDATWASQASPTPCP